MKWLIGQLGDVARFAICVSVFCADSRTQALDRFELPSKITF